MKHLSEEHKRKLSVSKTGAKNPFYGKKHSKETKKKMSRANKGPKNPMYGKHLTISTKTKMKMSISQKGRVHSEETIRKISETHKGILNPMYGKHLSKLTKMKMSAKTKGVPKPKGFGKKMSKAQTKLWQNSKHKKKQIKAMCNGISKAKPTKPERKLKNYLNHLFPRDYKFVGDGSIIIGNKKPDFININGQKKIIEMFGDYWHGEKRTKRTKYHEEQRRIRHFAKYGFRTLIIWQKELKNLPKLKRKLRLFHAI